MTLFNQEIRSQLYIVSSNLIATSIKTKKRTKKNTKKQTNKKEKKRNGIRLKAYISTKVRLGPLLNIVEFGKTNNSNSY